jgi:hypothetical protein
MATLENSRPPGAVKVTFPVSGSTTWSKMGVAWSDRSVHHILHVMHLDMYMIVHV